MIPNFRFAIERTEKAFNAEAAKDAEDTSAAPRLRVSVLVHNTEFMNG